MLERDRAAVVKQEGVLGLLLHPWLCQAEDIVHPTSRFQTGSSRQDPWCGRDCARRSCC